MTKTTTASKINAPAHENFDFGDCRINDRANKMLEVLGQHAEQTLPQAFHSRADLEGVYRFFDNELVSPEKILEPHFESTIQRCQGLDFVLVLQDSTDLDYDYLKTQGFGSMSSNVDNGFRVHPSLAVSESGTPLGLLGYKAYTREDGDDDSPKKHRNSLPIEEKESFRWLEGYRHANDLAQEINLTSKVVSISDREGDIYEVFAEAEENLVEEGAHVLIRAQHNRMLDGEGDNSLNRLEKKLNRSEVFYQATIPLNKGRGNERVATVNIRASSILFRAPLTGNKKGLRSIAVNAVLVSEIDPPEKKGEKGEDEGLYWLLLTTLPIDTEDDIKRVVQFYSMRWQIEIYFKVLKSGCRINRTRLQTRERIENLIAFSMLVGWRVMLTTYLAREFPDEPCTIAFTDLEWKLAYLSNNPKVDKVPTIVPTIQEMLILVAKLGGYRKRKSMPGIITVWRGVSRLFDIVHGHELANKILGR